MTFFKRNDTIANYSLSNSENWFCIIAAIVILFTSWTVYYQLPYGLVFQGILALFIFVIYGKYTNRRISIFIFFFFISLWYYRPMFFDISAMMSGFYRALIPCSLFLLSSDCQKVILKYLFYLIAIIAGIGAVLHILNFLGIYSVPAFTMVEMPERDFEIRPFLVYIYPSSFRFSSIFDEPGYLGTIIALYLALERYNFHKLINIVLLFCGILSLSFGFYVMLGIGMSIMSIKKRNYKPLILFVLLFAILYIFIPDFFELLFQREEVVSLLNGGKFEDSRGGYVNMVMSLKTINSMPIMNVLFGNGYDAPLFYFKENTNFLASSSIFRLVFQMGYVGVLLFIIGLINYTKKSSECIVFILLFIFSLYQRPHVFALMFFIMLANSFKMDRKRIKGSI